MNFAAEVGVRCPFEDRPALDRPEPLVPRRCAAGAPVVDGGLGPARSRSGHMSTSPVFSIWEVWAPPGPPDGDVLLDPVEALEGAVDVAGVELVLRDAVREQRLLDGVERMLPDRAAPRDAGHVPQVLPRRRRLLALEDVGAVGEDRRVDVVPVVVRVPELRPDLLHGGEAVEPDLLQVVAFLHELVGGRLAQERHVPGVRLGVDHALDLAGGLVLRRRPRRPRCRSPPGRACSTPPRTRP